MADGETVRLGYPVHVVGGDEKPGARQVLDDDGRVSRV